MQKVVVIKYNAGNIYSVVHALRRLGVEPVVTADEAVIRASDKVIFPGVGEATTTMRFFERTQDGRTDYIAYATCFGHLLGHAVDV